MKLITEQNFNDIETIIESKESGEKEYFISGPFMMAEEQNKNGRKYPKNILEKSVARYISEMIEQNRAYGELNHPNGPTINLERVSHRITSLHNEGNDYIGKAKVITGNPMGAIVRGLIESGGRIGVSSRGLGTLKKDGSCMVVQEDFRIATAADIVHDPSCPRAFVNGIMEGIDFFFDESTKEYREMKTGQIQNKIHKLSKSELEEQQLSIFESFVRELSLKKNIL